MDLRLCVHMLGLVNCLIVESGTYDMRQHMASFPVHFLAKTFGAISWKTASLDSMTISAR